MYSSLLPTRTHEDARARLPIAKDIAGCGTTPGRLLAFMRRIHLRLAKVIPRTTNAEEPRHPKDISSIEHLPSRHSTAEHIPAGKQEYDKRNVAMCGRVPDQWHIS